MGRIVDVMMKALAAIAVFLLLFITLATCFNIFARYLGFRGLIWSVQFTEYSVLWMTLLGAVWVLRHDKHVTVDLITSHLSPRIKSRFNFAHSVMGFAVCGVLCWYSAVVTWGQFQRGVVDIQVVDTPKYLVLIVIPIAFFGLMLEFLRKFFLGLKIITGGRNPSTDTNASPARPNFDIPADPDTPALNRGEN